jgi:drug/metabolite transporter (DMT)-like permease
MLSSHLGELAALGTAGCWTVTAMAFESAGRRVGSLSVNMIRLVMAMAFISLFCLATRGRLLPDDATPHAWLWLSVSGLVGFSLGDLCLFRAFVLVGARISMLIMALVPPLTALIGFMLLGEKLTGLDWAGMAVTISGVAWVVLERKKKESGTRRGLPPAGILLAFLGAVGQAIGLVLSKLGMGDYNPFAATQIRILAGMAGFAVLFSLVGWWPRVASALKDRGAFGRINLGAFFGPFLGVSLSLAAVQRTETGVASTIMSIVPVLIILPAILIFKEKVGPRAVLGAALAVAGVALLFL